MLRIALAALAVAFASIAAAPAARADLKLCNKTSSRIGVAIGYKDDKGWVSEGWWNVASNSCEVLLEGELVARYYYAHAVDYDRGGSWGGTEFMCTAEKTFTIRGVEECAARGHKRTGFFEIDAKEDKDWTVQLSDPEQPSAAN